jgi:hypothetical protein
MTTRADGALRETYGRYSQHVDGAGGSGAYGFGESKAEDSHGTQPQPHATSSQFVVRPSSTADIYSLTRTQPVNYSSPKPPRAFQPHAAGAEVLGGRGGPTAASSMPASASSSSSSSSGPQHRHQVPSHGHQPHHHQQSRVSGPGATGPVRSAVDISDEEIARDPMFVEILSHALRGDAVGQSSQSTVAGAAGSTAADIQENDRIASLAQSIRNTLLASPSAVVGAATRRAQAPSGAARATAATVMSAMTRVRATAASCSCPGPPTSSPRRPQPLLRMSPRPAARPLRVQRARKVGEVAAVTVWAAVTETFEARISAVTTRTRATKRTAVRRVGEFQRRLGQAYPTRSFEGSNGPPLPLQVQVPVWAVPSGPAAAAAAPVPAPAVKRATPGQHLRPLAEAAARAEVQPLRTSTCRGRLRPVEHQRLLIMASAQAVTG